MKIFKVTLRVLSLILATIFLVGCSKDASLDAAKTGSINISFTSSSLKSDLQVQPQALLVTIRDVNGAAMYQNKVIKLYKINDSYTGEALQLTVGKYYIEEFMVLGDSNKVVYIAPKAGSKKASLVKQALPIWFAIESNVTTSLSPEVVRPDGQAADYGYAQFGFTVVDENPSFDSVCLRIGSLDKTVYTMAKIIVQSDAGIKTMSYTGGLVSMYVPKSKTAYNITFYSALLSSIPKTITIAASEADTYSCSGDSFVDLFSSPVTSSYCFETLVCKTTSTTNDYTVTIASDGSISCDKIKTLVAVYLTKGELIRLDSILQLANVYAIKQSDALCKFGWGRLDNYTIANASQKVSYIAQYTGECGMTKDAASIDNVIQEYVKKYFGEIPQTIKSDYTIKVGDTFSISLTSNPSTGYSWMWASKVQNDIITPTVSTAESDTLRKGAPVTEVWTFTGLKQGTASVVLKYMQSWDSSSVAETKTFTVTVQ